LKNKIFKNKHYQFHNQIQTDGISCCLLFIRKYLKDKKLDSRVHVLQEQYFHTIEDLTKEQLDTLKHRNIVGCEPGKHSLVYMMYKKGNKLQYLTLDELKCPIFILQGFIMKNMCFTTIS
jgi:hypothetical protein